MKVFKKILIVLLLILIIMPFKVHAEPTQYKDYEFKLYELDIVDLILKLETQISTNVDDESNIVIPADILFFTLMMNNRDLFDVEEIETEDSVDVTYYLKSNNNKILHFTIDLKELYELDESGIYDELSPFKQDFSIYDQYTVDDSFIYTLTEQDKERLDSLYSNLDPLPFTVQSEEPLNTYDRIVFRLSNADDTKDGVYINRVRLSEKTGTTFVNNKPVVDGLLLDLDLEFKNVGDYAIYRVEVRNNTDKEYQINDAPVYGTDNYVKYEFSFEDDSNILEPNTAKIMYVKASYDKEIPQEVFAAAPGGSGYVENKKLEVALISETGDVGNPNTSDNLMTSVLVIMISIAIIIVMIKVQALRKGLMIVLAGVILIPTIANAIEKLNITINAKVEIKSPYKKFCVYTDEDNTEKEYYDYKEGTTWNEYYEDNKDFPYFSDIRYATINYYHYEKPYCVSSPNPYLQNGDMYGFDIVGYSMRGRIIDCNTGLEQMEHDDPIESSEYGCYEIVYTR